MGLPSRSAPPPPAAAGAAPTACSPTRNAARPPRHPPQRAPASVMSRATSIAYHASRNNSYACHCIVGFVQQPSQAVLALHDLRLAWKALLAARKKMHLAHSTGKIGNKRAYSDVGVFAHDDGGACCARSARALLHRQLLLDAQAARCYALLFRIVHEMKNRASLYPA